MTRTNLLKLNLPTKTARTSYIILGYPNAKETGLLSQKRFKITIFKPRIVKFGHNIIHNR